MLGSVMKTIRLVGVVSLGLCCTSASAMAQLRLCDWKAAGNLPVRQQNNKIVEWGSIADEAGPDLWNISNYVVNLDASHARNIDWEAGSMRVEGLGPNNIAVICQGKTAGRMDRDGPLYFARDVSSMATQVYAGRLPTSSSVVAGAPLALSTDFTLAPSPDPARTPGIRVQIHTDLVKTEAGYEITYTITNLSASDVIVDLPLDSDTLKEFDGGHLVLKKGETRKAKALSSQFPAAVRFPARIQESSLKGPLSTVSVPTLRAQPAGRGRGRG
jgi:hypothetical protein